MTDWRPIETAPKWEKVLVWCPMGPYRGKIAFGKQSYYPISGDTDFVWTVEGSRPKAAQYPPTAWAPLPLPPKF